MQAGCQKYDFFVKQEYYDLFLSQFALDQSNSSSSPNVCLSEILPSQDDDIKNPDTALPKKKRKVRFTLGLEEDIKDIADKYKEDEYIEYIGGV